MPYSAEAAERVVRFFARALVHSKGRWAGQSFDLLAWQRDKVIRPLFGTLKEDGTRQYRTCYVEVPRKNGKSTLAGGLALYLLTADGEMGAEVYSAAGDRDQAMIVFRSAAEMVRQSTVLNDRLKILDSVKRMVEPKTNSFYRAISAEAASAHGYNAHGIIVDEVHVQPNRDLIDVLTTSTGARRQPLVFFITTAGFDRHSICWELHEYARQVRDGLIVDPTFLPVLYGADVSDDWRQPATWAKANPSMGETITEEYLATEAKRAREVPAYENTFRRLHLCQWTSQDSRWLSLAKWDEGADPIDLDDLKGRTCYAGLDLASTTDIAALSLVFPLDDGTYTTLAYFWIPGENIAERVRRDRVPYDQWVSQGHIIATPGNVIDYASIRGKLDELAQTFNLRELGFDRWGATQLIQELQDGGLEVVTIGQGFMSMSAPTKELLNLVIAGRLKHGGNPVLRWMADNVAVEQDAAGNVKPSKSKSREKIDGIVALIMAVDRASRHGNATSVYETERLFIV